MKIHPKFAKVLKRQQEKQAAECKRINKLQRMALARPEYRTELAEKVIKAGIIQMESK